MQHAIKCRNMLAYLSRPADVACKQIKDEHIFRECVHKIALTRSLLAQNALNIVWRPGSTRTRWESLQRSRKPIARFKGPTSKGRGVEEKKWRGARDGEKRKQWGGKGGYASLSLGRMDATAVMHSLSKTINVQCQQISIACLTITTVRVQTT